MGFNIHDIICKDTEIYAPWSSNPGMRFTDSEVMSQTATDKMQKKSVCDCLYVIVEPARKGGGKSFYGELRHLSPSSLDLIDPSLLHPLT